MTAPNQPPFEDVLDMLLAAHDAPTAIAVADFAERYPAYRADLIRFAADWADQAYRPVPDPMSVDDEDRVFARAQSFLQNAVYEQQASRAATSAETLYDLAKSAGVSLREVARAAGLNVSLVTKLNRRSIRPAGVRPHIAEAIGRLLAVDTARVMRCWSGPPIMAGATFIAGEAGLQNEQEDFAAAVEASSLSPEEKAAALGEAA